MKRAYTSSSTKIAQTLIMQGLDVANDSTQALLLELIVTKELRISNVRYNVPKPFFLVISVLPQGYSRLSISSQLVDISKNIYISDLELIFYIDGSIFC
jgi:hypothetical protein